MSGTNEYHLARAVESLILAFDELAYAVGHQAIGGEETIRRAQRLKADAVDHLSRVQVDEPTRPPGERAP